jgi:NACHT domain
MSPETSRLVALVLVGDRFVEAEEPFDIFDDVPTIEDGIASYLLADCELMHRDVEIEGTRGEAPIYISRRNPTLGYVVLPTSEPQMRPSQQIELTPKLEAYLIALTSQLRRFDHEHARGPRDLWHSFVRPRLALKQPDDVSEHEIPWEHLQGIQKAIVLGPPGAGKTSLLRRVGAHYAEAILETGVGVIPVYVELRHLSGPNVSMARLRDIATTVGDFQFEHAASTGELLLLLDGLDEIIDTDRSQVADAIGGIAAANPRVKVIVSSRAVGYHGEFSDFATIQVLPFGQAQVNEWVWLSEPNPDLWTEFLGQVAQNQDVGDLMFNPLLLSIAFYMFQASAIVPRERAGLSQYCVRALSDDWDRARGVQRSHLWRNPRMLFAYVCWLAYELNEREADTFSENDALRRRPSFFGSTQPGFALQALAEKSGIIAKTRSGEWAFTHAAIRDYLAGEYIAAGPHEAAAILREPLGSPRKRSTWMFACGAALQADPLIQWHMRAGNDLSGGDAALLVDALRQDLEVLEDVVKRGAQLVMHVLERELADASVMERENAVQTTATGAIEIVLGSGESQTVKWLVAAVLGARGAAFADTLRNHLVQSDLLPVAMIGGLLDADQPMVAELEYRDKSRVLTLRPGRPDGLPLSPERSPGTTASEAGDAMG